MAGNTHQSRTVCFGLFEVDLSAGELRKNGVKIKLQDQPFRVLVTLLRHAGDVVTRDECVANCGQAIHLWTSITG